MASKSILVPLDGSSFAERAIPLAAWYSVATGSGVRFIHVLAAETEPTERSRAADLFQTYASRVSSKAGLSTADCEVLVGSPHEEVVAASVTAAAIVIATHGRSGLRPAVIGSTADKIIRGFCGSRPRGARREGQHPSRPQHTAHCRTWRFGRR